MKILSMDTSYDKASLSVADGERIKAEHFPESNRRQSAILLDEIKLVLRDAETAIEDIDVFAVAEGPGSFTGLRIGMSTMKTLAYASKAKLVTVSSLEAAAHNALEDVPADMADKLDTICVIMDARNDQVYAAAYFLCNYKPAMPQRSGSIYEVLDALKNTAGIDRKRILFAGSGASVHADSIKKTFGDETYIAYEANAYPTASAVSQIAYQKALKEEFADIASAVPEYLRKSQAERLREEKQNG